MGSSSSVLDIVDAFKTLRGRDVPLDEHAFWKPFFTSNVSPVDLFAIVTPKLLRELRRVRPSGFASLVYKCVEQLMVFASVGSKAGDPRSALNALAILSRVLPFALEPLQLQQQPPQHMLVESSAPSTAVAEQEVVSPSPYSENFAVHVFIDGLRCMPDGSRFPPLPGGEPLHVALVRAIVDLCFIPGFSIGPYQQPTAASATSSSSSWPADTIDAAILWAPGIGSVPSLASPINDATIAHRRAILSTLLVLLSVPLYGEEAIAPEPMFRDVLTLGVPPASPDSGSGGERTPLPLSATFFASLWNTVTSYDPCGSLPYTSHFVSEHESLVCIAAQVLGACMDYSSLLLIPMGQSTRTQPPPAEGPREASGDPLPPAASLLSSMAWRLVMTCSEAQAAQLLSGLCRLIENHTYARSTYLPKSQRPFPIFDELVMLLWKLLDRAPSFLKAFSQQQGGGGGASAAGGGGGGLKHQPALALAMLVPLMDFAFGAREKPQQLFQQLQITLFILQRVTVERDFCLLCNTPFRQFVPFTFPPFSGTYNDFIVIGMCALMALPGAAGQVLAPFHESMAHVLSNVAPFMTTVSSVAAEKLVRILLHWSSADVLQPPPPPPPPSSNTAASSDDANNRNPYTLALVVEAIATLLQYQYPGSFTLAAELAKHEARIAQLASDYRSLSLPIPEGLRGKLLIPTLHCAATCIAEALKKATLDGKTPLAGGADTAADPAVLEFVRRTTLVGSLPIPHQIVCRRIDSGYSTDAWLTKVFWGAVFLHSIPGTLVDYRAIRLFATSAS